MIISGGGIHANRIANESGKSCIWPGHLAVLILTKVETLLGLAQSDWILQMRKLHSAPRKYSRAAPCLAISTYSNSTLPFNASRDKRRMICVLENRHVGPVLTTIPGGNDTSFSLGIASMIGWWHSLWIGIAFL